MPLACLVAVGLIAMFTYGATDEPASRPVAGASSQPSAFVPDDADLRAAMETLLALRALPPDAPIEQITALQLRPAGWDDNRVRRDHVAGKSIKITPVDGRRAEQVASFIVRMERGTGAAEFGVSRLVKIDGQWRALVVSPSGYRSGELSADQIRAFDAQVAWIRTRAGELRGK